MKKKNKMLSRIGLFLIAIGLCVNQVGAQSKPR